MQRPSSGKRLAQTTFAQVSLLVCASCGPSVPLTDKEPDAENGTSSEDTEHTTGESETADPCAEAVAIDGDLHIEGPTYDGPLPLTVGGSVTVNAGTDSRHDIAELRCLTEVGGRVEVWGNPALTDVSGLANLRRVGGVLAFTNNPVLTEIGPFPALEAVSGVRVTDHTALTSLRLGTQSLRLTPAGNDEENSASLTVAGTGRLVELDLDVDTVVLEADLLRIELRDLPNLESAQLAPWTAQDGVALRIREAPVLSNIEFAGTQVAELSITSVPLLGSLAAFGTVERVTGTLRLGPGETLTDLSDLANLKSVRNLYIGGCADQHQGGLESLDGVEGLEELTNFFLAGNPALTDVSTLLELSAQLTPPPSLVLVQNNPLLAQEDVEALATASGTPVDGNPDICGNAGEPACKDGVGLACSLF